MSTALTLAQLRNQVKQLKQAKQNQRQPQRQQPQRIPRSLTTESAAHGICDITNPFCPGAAHAKWPDGSSAPTLSIPRRGRFLVTTNASGAAGIMLSPTGAGDIDGIVGTFNYDTWEFYAPTNPQNGLILSPQLSELSSGHTHYDQVRTVSAGFAFTPTLSYTDAKGFASWIESSPVVLSKPDGDLPYFTILKPGILHQPTYYTFPLRKNDTFYIAARPSGTEAREFKDVGKGKSVIVEGSPLYTSPAVIDTSDWSSIYFVANGAPPNTVIGYIDVFQNVEVTLNMDGQGAMNAMLTSAPPMNVAYMKASQALTTRSFTHAGNNHTVDQSFYGRAKQYVSSRLQDQDFRNMVRDVVPGPIAWGMDFVGISQHPNNRNQNHISSNPMIEYVD